MVSEIYKIIVKLRPGHHYSPGQSFVIRLYTVAFVYLAVLFCCQAQPYFSKAIDLNNHQRERIRKFVIIDTLIYASTGQRCNENDCTSLVMIDLEGNLIDFRLFSWLDGGDQEYIIYDGSNIVMSGHKGWFDDAFYYLQVCNLDLDSLGTGIYTTEDSVMLLANKSVIKYNDSFLVVGFTRPINNINWPTDQFWINSDLSIDTTIRLTLGDRATSFNEGVVDNNGLLNILYQFDSSSDIGFHRGIIRLNDDKEIVSIWETPFQHTTTIFENMLILDNNNFVVMEQDEVNDYELMFLTYDGEYLFSSVLESTGYDSKTPIEIRVARNGDILGCGVYQATQLDTFGCCIYTGYIFRMSPDGDLIWERIIIEHDSTGQYMDGTFSDIRELPNGDLILGGDIEALHLPEHDSDMWLVRTDSMGCLKPGCGEIQVVTGTKDVRTRPTKNNMLDIYPNPASDRISLSIAEHMAGRILKFDIRDVHGQVLLSDFDYNGSSIDVSGLIPGVYIVSVEYRGHILAMKRFVKVGW